LPSRLIRVNINNNSALIGLSKTYDLPKNIKSLRAPAGAVYIKEDFKGVILEAQRLKGRKPNKGKEVYIL
jgi:hypothetical protein